MDTSCLGRPRAYALALFGIMALLATLAPAGTAAVPARSAAQTSAQTPLPAQPSWSVESDTAEAYFGSSAGTAGDVNGDGYSDLVVGAPFFSNGQGGQGRAFVYLGGPSGLSASPAWSAGSDRGSADTGHYSDLFGWSVGTAGDVNGDGYSDIVVGGPYYDSGQIDEGRAAVYLGGANGLSLSPAWCVEGGQADALFGYAVATAGDVNGDGYSDIVVSAPSYHDNNGMGDPGRVYVYLGGAQGLSSSPAWSVQSDRANAGFGWSVGTAGDVNGDGYSDIIVGAPFYNRTGDRGGMAAVYLGGPRGLSSSPSWRMQNDRAYTNFGIAVGMAGDVNGDGYSDIIVGTESGAWANVYCRCGLGRSQIADLLAAC